MTKTKGVSVGKPEKRAINEDAVLVRKNMVAVSDGAGGGGLFADRWSQYLIKNLPNQPIISAEELDKWIGDIWEPYYNKAEESAKRLGGMALDKFYDEGSFATLAAVWRLPDGSCRWMAYGDSVVFHYDYASKILTHSFSHLADFDHPPYLINCKDELDYAGFRSGEFKMLKSSLVFVASDALSHYVMMMYELSKREQYSEEINNAVLVNTKNSNLLSNALSISPFKFENRVIEKIRRSVYDKNYYRKWMAKLQKSGLLALDDYSLAVMYD